jgi:hypothetical protein
LLASYDHLLHTVDDFHQEFDCQDFQHLLEFELQQKKLVFIAQALNPLLNSSIAKFS